MNTPKKQLIGKPLVIYLDEVDNVVVINFRPNRLDKMKAKYPSISRCIEIPEYDNSSGLSTLMGLGLRTDAWHQLLEGKSGTTIADYTVIENIDEVKKRACKGILKGIDSTAKHAKTKFTVTDKLVQKLLILRECSDELSYPVVICVEEGIDLSVQSSEDLHKVVKKVLVVHAKDMVLVDKVQAELKQAKTQSDIDTVITNNKIV